MSQLEIVMVPTEELTAYEGNAKIHTDAQVEQIVQSIEEFDFADPIAAWHDEDGNSVLVEGHGRLMAAQKLGIEELPVIYLDYMSDEERRAYTLVHNQLTMNTGFQEDTLQAELSKIQGIDMGLFDFQDISDVEFGVAPDTCISNKVSTIPKTLQEYAGFAGDMYDKAQTLFNGWSVELFYDYIASIGVRSVTEYEEPSSAYTKKYGYFVV